MKKKSYDSTSVAVWYLGFVKTVNTSRLIIFLLSQLLTDEEELCVEAVTQSWELVQGLTSNANDFWSGLKGFVSMAFNPQLLQLSHGQALKFTSTLKKVIHFRSPALN